MKEFDIEKAKAGAPVCTRDGRPVRIICWCYYHYSMISFQSDILEELHILEDWRIDKPGTAPEKYDQLQDRLDRKFKAKVMNISEDGETARAIATYRRWKKHRSIGINDRRSRLYNADRVHYSKGAMQRRNHGH